MALRQAALDGRLHVVPAAVQLADSWPAFATELAAALSAAPEGTWKPLPPPGAGAPAAVQSHPSYCRASSLGEHGEWHVRS